MMLMTLGVQMLALGAAAARGVPMVLGGAASAANAATADAPAAQEGPRCESQRPQYGDTMQVQCALREEHASRKFKFEVRFLGGHDDTRASLSGTLDGKPLACEEGSKPELEGEFGEISIDCRFSSDAINGAQELKIAVQWYHAQYAEFRLDTL